MINSTAIVGDASTRSRNATVQGEGFVCRRRQKGAAGLVGMAEDFS